MAKLLVVDDEPAFLSGLKWMFSGCGHEVETAADGVSCVTAALRMKPDVLIIDYMLRDHSSGVDLARSLHSTLPKMKIILMTGYPSQELQTQASQFFAVLEKPFLPDEISSLIDNATRGCVPDASERPGSQEPLSGVGHTPRQKPQARPMYNRPCPSGPSPGSPGASDVP